MIIPRKKPRPVELTLITNPQLPSSKTQKLESLRLQINEKLRVGQNIISDPSNVYYTEEYSPLKTTPSADWQ